MNRVTENWLSHIGQTRGPVNGKDAASDLGDSFETVSDLDNSLEAVSDLGDSKETVSVMSESFESGSGLVSLASGFGSIMNGIIFLRNFC